MFNSSNQNPEYLFHYLLKEVVADNCVVYPGLKSLKLASFSPPSISGSHALSSQCFFFLQRSFIQQKQKTYSVSRDFLKENEVEALVNLILKSTFPTPEQEERQRHAASRLSSSGLPCEMEAGLHWTLACNHKPLECAM